MSLHHAAQHLAAQGRHGDDMLVHMNRNEVAGLQALAQKHGKTLHTNPTTGYPEAFNLGQELENATSGVGAPIIGAGISVLSGGTIDPITAAAIVGGTQALASGNLQKGLMSGLGAWGGASLGAGVMGMGQSALGAEAYNAANVAGATPESLQSAVSDKIASTGTWDTLKAGASAAANDPKAALAALGSGSAWKGAGILGAAAAPILAGNMVQTATPAPGQSQGLIRPYTFQRKVVTPTNMVQATYQPGQDTSERNWFQDTFTAQTPYASPGPEYKKAATGGVMRMAGGGDVQSDPNMQQVPAFDPVVRMADGGAVDYGSRPQYVFDPVRGQYVLQGDAFDPSNPQGLGIAALAEKLNAATDPNSVARQTMPQYVFDPNTQTFTLVNPGYNIPKIAPIDTSGYTGYDSGGGGGGDAAASGDSGDAGDSGDSGDSGDGGSGSGSGSGTGTGAGDSGSGSGEGSGDGGAGAGSGDGGAGAGSGGDGGGSGGDGGGSGGSGGGDGGGSGGGDGGGGGGDGGGGGEAAGGLAPYFRRMYAGGMPYAEGGVTGSGSLNLNIPLNLGGGQNDVEGYQAAGSGNSGGSLFTAPSVSGGMLSQAGAGGYGPPMDPRMMQGGLDSRAIAANPQGFQQMLQMAQQRERMMPGTTFLSQMGSMGLGALRMAGGGSIPSLGGYASGGNPRLLSGPGDGMSDNIPAVIGGKQPARLADGEFVVPADVVSHLGNGSTEAGAKQLYKMMDRIRAARTGKKKQAPAVKTGKYLPA